MAYDGAGAHHEQGNAIDLSLINPRPGIKSITGGDILYSDQSATYSMHKFPQLDTLHLNVDLETIEDFVEVVLESNKSELSTNIMLRYFRYLLNIPSFM